MMVFYKKSIGNILIALLLGNSAFAQSVNDKVSIVTNKISSIKSSNAPDRRTSVFKVTPVITEERLELNGMVTDQTAKNQLLSSLSELNIAFDDKIEVLPSSSLGDKIHGVANLSVCNNRFEPEHAAEMATQMTLGTPVDVLLKQGGWCLVRTPDGYISWTEAMGVGLMNDQQFSDWKKADKIMFTGYFGHSFSKPSVKSAIVSDLVKGSILTILKEEKGFYKVEYPDLRIAYVEKSQAIHLKNWLKSAKPTAENIIATAKTLLGSPYLWGGTSVKGVDCSGFIKTSFFLNGIILPRDASQQVLAGEKVDIVEDDTMSVSKCLNNLMPGDLLFFSSKQDGNLNAKVTHVGMYIGNGEFIHSAGMVRINSLRKQDSNYADWQTKTLIAARRMLSQINDKEITQIQNHPFYSSTK